MYQLTTHTKNIDFVLDIVNNINRDFPKSAAVNEDKGTFAVEITDEHKKYCEDYVQTHCRLKPEEE